MVECEHPWSAIEITVVEDMDGRLLIACSRCFCILPLPKAFEITTKEELIRGVRAEYEQPTEKGGQ